jgi:hypothetical protein
LPRRPTIEINIYEIRCRLAVVADEVAHENIEDVIVDRDPLVKSGHREK